MQQARPHPPSGRSRSRRTAQRWWAEARVEQPAKHLPKLSRSQNARREPLMGRWAPLRGGCCQTCHAPLTFRGRERKFCSTACHTISRHPGFGTCEYCGDAFTLPAPSNRKRGEGKYCSKSCRAMGAHWESPLHRRVRCAVGISAAARKAKKVCRVCGAMGARMECGPVCRQEMARRRAMCETPHETRECSECGGAYTPNHGNRRIFCSRRCAKKHGKRNRRHAKRARSSGHPIYWSLVWRQAGGKCALCGQRVERDTNPSNPRGATVDHIVPLSRGGEHAPWNVQLAHRSCNSAKGARSFGSQMRLAV